MFYVAMFMSQVKAFTCFSRHRVHLTISKAAVHVGENNGERKSVSGIIYEVEGDKCSFPIVTLFTKEGCTLCDKVTDVLQSIRKDHPHSLEAVDITDEDKTHIYDMYKWDIPVLKINGLYWTKHRVEQADAICALVDAASGNFHEKKGEPNAAEMEKRMAIRKISQEK